MKESLLLLAKYAPMIDEAAGLIVWLPKLSKSNPATVPVIKSGILVSSAYHSNEFEFAVVKENEIFFFTMSISVTWKKSRTRLLPSSFVRSRSDSQHSFVRAVSRQSTLAT